MKLINPTLLLGAFGVAAALWPVAASAQGGQRPAKQLADARVRVTPEYEVRVLKVRNVTASMMAYWLDPVHNEMPSAFRQSANLRAQAQGLAGWVDTTDRAAAAAKWQQRFPGVQVVTPQDSRSQVLVVGTPGSFTEVEAELMLLDKPLKNVEVEAQFVETDPENIRAMGLKIWDFKPESELRKISEMAVGNAGVAVDEKLKAHVAEGKAKVLANFSVSLLSGLYNAMGTGQSMPTTVSIKDKGGQLHELDVKADGADYPQAMLNLDSQLLAKAIVNQDETISLEIEPSRKLNLAIWKRQLEGFTTEPIQDISPQIPLRTVENLRAVINLRDGESVALNGVTHANNPMDVINGIKAKNGILIVTARIIRR